MSKFELEQIYLQLEHEIKRLSQSTDIVYRDATREDAQQAVIDLKSDIDNWVVRLRDRSISCYELENLLENKRSKIKLMRLKNKGLDEMEMEIFKGDVLRLIARALINTYLESLFRNQKTLNQFPQELYEQ
ncbi:MAG: hypothetical protein PHH37_09125 [Paludibacter sp.]|nr:hypothetical protein [Paludibacter sp.]